MEKAEDQDRRIGIWKDMKKWTQYSGKHEKLCTAGERDACGTRVGDKNKNIEPENQTKEYVMEIHAYLSNVFKPSSKNEMKESLKFTL